MSVAPADPSPRSVSDIVVRPALASPRSGSARPSGPAPSRGAPERRAGEARRRPGAPIGLAFVLAACNAGSGDPRSPVTDDAPEGPVLTVLDIDGTCAPLPGDDPMAELDLDDAGQAHSPRPPLPATAYTVALRVRPSSSGDARLRSRLVFDAHDERNVLGRVPSGTVLLAAGPMKNSSGSQGLGYSVQVRDPTGLRCQAFVSATVVDPIEPVPAPPP